MACRQVIDFEPLYRRMHGTRLEAWLPTLKPQLTAAFDSNRHGDLPRWLEALEQLPALKASTVDFNHGSVTLDGAASDSERESIHAALRGLIPWRKGPYSIYGTHIDTEWRSDWKWDRLAEQITPLEGRRVLDVGCGNGYHCWRMRGAGAKLVVGIDPSMLFNIQFQAVSRFAEDEPVFVLPLGIQHLPERLEAFDSVFSMGVLYHRRAPIDHLLELKAALRPGGELILETLIIKGDEQQVLVPRERYAKMRNVWFIPSDNAVLLWLARAGFRDIRLVDATTTSVEEQRRTDWMQFESLADYLDPNDHNRTIEGYPAPRRGIFIARKPA